MDQTATKHFWRKQFGKMQITNAKGKLLNLSPLLQKLC